MKKKHHLQRNVIERFSERARDHAAGGEAQDSPRTLEIHRITRFIKMVENRRHQILERILLTKEKAE